MTKQGDDAEASRPESAWAQIRAALSVKPGRAIGFAFCLVWVFVASHSLSISVTFAFAQGLSARVLLQAGTCVGALLVYGLQRRGYRFGSSAIMVAALCMLSGFLLFAFPEELHVPQLVSLCCVFASGMGYGVLFLAWLALLEEKKPSQSLASFGMAILAASLIDCVVLVLPHYVLLALMPCLPIASALVYVRELGSRDTVSKDRHRQAEKDASSRWADKTRGQKASVLFVVPLLIEGFAYGSFLQLTFSEAGSLENNVGVIALIVTALLLLVTALLWGDLKRSVPLFVLFALMALVYSIIPLFHADARVTIFVLMLGYNYFYFFALALCAEMRKVADVSLLTCAIFVVLSFEIGNAAGSLFLASAVVPVDSNTFMTVVSGAVVYSLLVGAFAAIQYLSHAQEDRAVRAEADAHAEKFCEAHGLSRRECEVLELLAKGRTAAVIAEKLFISTETARVHIKSIYRKVDVHSQQELIERFEGADEQLSSIPDKNPSTS